MRQPHRVHVWDANSGEQRCKIIDGGQGWVYGLAFSPDDKVLASATPYHVCLWDAANGKQLKEFNKDRVSGAVAFDKAGKRLVTGGDVCVIDPASHEIVRRMGQGGNFAFAVALSPDGKTIASNAVYDERIRLWDAETGKEKPIVAGHMDGVRDVAFSPDGKLIATASGGDGTVRLWDAARGTEVHVLKLNGELNHFSRGRPVLLTFSVDGRTLNAAGQSWDVATGKEMDLPVDLRGRPGISSPDGRTIARIEAGTDKYGVVVLRDGLTGRLLRRLPNQGEQGKLFFNSAMGFSPDGRLLVTGCQEETRGEPGRLPPSVDSVRVWDVATGKLLRAFRPARRIPASVAFAPDGNLVVTSASWQQPVQLWDATTGKEVRKLAGYEDDEDNGTEVHPFAFSPDGGLLATSGKDNRIVIWETATGEIVRRLAGHSRPVCALAFSPDGKTLVSGSAETSALVWPVAPPDTARKWNADKANDLWKALEGKAADAFPLVWALAAAPEQAVPFLAERLRPEAADERQLARWIDELGHDKFPVREEAMNRLRELGTRAEPALRKALAGQKDAERRRRLEELVARLDEKAPDTVLLRDLRAILALEQMGTPPAEKLLETLANGVEDGPRTRAAQAALIRLEDRRERSRVRPAPAFEKAPQGREPSKLYAHEGEVRAVAFTPDGKTALSAAQDGKVRRWDVTAARELPALAGHEGGTFALAVSPDGKRLASAGADGRVRLWDLRTGVEVASLAGHKGTVYAVAFNADGKLLGSGGADGTARIWDVDKKEERHLIRAAKDRVTTVVFSADGESLMTGSVFEAISSVDDIPCLRYYDEPIRLWKTATGAEVRKLDQRGTTLALAGDGKRLLVIAVRLSMVGRNGERGMSIEVAGNVLFLDVATGKSQMLAEGYGGAAALSADGRLLATARGSNLHISEKVRHRDIATSDPGALRLWETLTGQEVLRFAGDPPTVLAFAPDGRHLLFGTSAGAVCLVETAPPGVGDHGKLDRKALETSWTELASGDAAVAYRAQAALSAAREEAPAFLAERLRPAPADDAVMKRLIADLDAERYVVRRAAFAELASRGAETEPALRAALKQTDSPRVKQRLEELLAAPTLKVLAEPTRRRRAAQVLERIGTLEAKKILADLPPLPEPGHP